MDKGAAESIIENLTIKDITKGLYDGWHNVEATKTVSDDVLDYLEPMALEAQDIADKLQDHASDIKTDSILDDIAGKMINRDMVTLALKLLDQASVSIGTQDEIQQALGRKYATLRLPGDCESQTAWTFQVDRDQDSAGADFEIELETMTGAAILSQYK